MSLSGNRIDGILNRLKLILNSLDHLLKLQNNKTSNFIMTLVQCMLNTLGKCMDILKSVLVEHLGKSNLYGFWGSGYGMAGVEVNS